MVYTSDLKSDGASLAGSSLASGTIYENKT